MRTVLLLVISNCFMTFAWYGQLANKTKHLSLWKIVLISWAIAFFEYCFMVPANNKFGQLEGFNPFQLKTIQEVISLIIFSLFAIYFLGEPIKWNYIVAFVFIIAAVYFMFLPTHR
ncbi:MAG: DMT family protein [Bacteroidota bacterium]|nr:DMT family protein [Bacteroidota bacterium]